MARTIPTFKTCEPYPDEFAVECTWINDDGIEEERYLWFLESRHEADDIVERLTRWVDFRVRWRAPIHDVWLEFAIKSAYESRLVRRWLDRRKAA